MLKLEIEISKRSVSGTVQTLAFLWDDDKILTHLPLAEGESKAVAWALADHRLEAALRFATALNPFAEIETQITNRLDD